MDYAWNKGVFLTCAAGNGNTSSYPAYYSNCFAAASTNSSDARSSFPNYGTDIVYPERHPQQRDADVLVVHDILGGHVYRLRLPVQLFN